MPSNVDHPVHYNSHPSGIEAITICEHMSFNVGNAIKYLWRSNHKNGIEDLKKAAWYVNREIERMEKANQSDINKRPVPGSPESFYAQGHSFLHAHALAKVYKQDQEAENSNQNIGIEELENRKWCEPCNGSGWINKKLCFNCGGRGTPCEELQENLQPEK